MKLPRILLVFALAAPGLAWGQGYDQPGRIARLTYVEGEVTFQGVHERATSTLPDRPLEPGDLLRTDPGARAELALGSAVIRLDERSEIAVVDLDADTTRIELNEGTASVMVDELLENEVFEIVTPNTTIAIEQQGEYRTDVYGTDDSALTVHDGVASVATSEGEIRVTTGQRVQLSGRDAFARLQILTPKDDFDNWVLERELRLADAQPPRYTPYEGGDYGSDELDRYGDWYDDPYYGRVWMPGYGYSGWSPYDGGYWQRVDYGWGWYDPVPWSYYTYYSGRWGYLRDRNRWYWVPSRHHPWRHRRDHETPESGPRTAGLQQPWIEGSTARGGTYTRGGDRDRVPSASGGERSATPVLTPRRIAPDRRPTEAREHAADERPRGGTYDRGSYRERGSSARGGDRERAESAPPAAPTRSSGTTMRPERADRGRSESAPRSSQSRREFGPVRDR
jgi:hypothetical protein